MVRYNPSEMSSPSEAFEIHQGEVRGLVDSYRTQCLWFLREDFYPANAEEAVRVLHQIERKADLEGFRRAARLRAWLAPTAGAPSVAS